MLLPTKHCMTTVITAQKETRYYLPQQESHILQNFMTTLVICFFHSLWATWMCCLSFPKESMCIIPCVLCWFAWQHTSVWAPGVWTVLASKLLSLKMICQQSMSVKGKILHEEVSYSHSRNSSKQTPVYWSPLIRHLAETYKLIQIL